MAAHVHVVGAGLAGLAAAVALVRRGMAVSLHEAAGHAGGRCRSYRDRRLDREIDNGNHLILSGNAALLDHLQAIGAGGGLREIAPARFGFRDLASGASWHLAPGETRYWALKPGTLPPGIGAAGLIADVLRLATAGAADDIGARLDVNGIRFRRLWGPLAVAALNTEAKTASARGFWAVVRETLLRGEAASRPLLADRGLSHALIEPAVDWLRRHAVDVRLNARLRRLVDDGDRVTGLDFADGTLALGPRDAVLLALPPWGTEALLPWLPPTRAYSAILNAHFVLPPGAPGLAPELPFVGLLGGTAEWLFQRGDVLSVTVSAANRFAGETEETLAAGLWRDVARVLALPETPVPPCRLIVEKRATPAQTPAWEATRPGPRTRLANLVLAGDWTDTGLPATLEGAVRSGRRAAALLAGGE